MPENSGAQLVEEARRIRPDLGWLFMSGYTGDIVGLQKGLTNQVTLLEKPFTRRSLLAKVYAVLHAKPQ